MEERSLTYQSEDQQVTLTPSIVRQLVRGGGALSPFELMTALHLCKTRGLNPFVGDVYLIKYGSDPLSLVVSIDFLRARAKASADCGGWTVGVIVQDGKTGQVSYTNGLVPPGAILLGGWAEAQPAGWNVSRRVEVNLEAYVKKTVAGRPTKFWSDDMRPTMIAKVAEAQLLRSVWPRLVSKFYLAEELGVEDTELPPTLDGVTGQEEAQAGPDQECAEAVKNLKEAFPGSQEVIPPEKTQEEVGMEFIDWIRMEELPELEVGRFVGFNSERYGTTNFAIMKKALGRRQDFKTAFLKWHKARLAKEATEAAKKAKEAPEQQPLDLSGAEIVGEGGEVHGQGQ